MGTNFCNVLYLSNGDKLDISHKYLYYKILLTWVNKKYPNYLTPHTLSVASNASRVYGSCLLYTCGLLHDILEDTDCTPELLKEKLTQFVKYIPLSSHKYDANLAVKIIEYLTKPKNETYHSYMQRFNRANVIFMECEPIVFNYAYDIKKEDYKDHFFRYETLTPKLLEKYKPFVYYFL